MKWLLQRRKLLKLFKQFSLTLCVCVWERERPKANIMSLIDMAACRSSCLLGDNITRFPARSSSPSPSPISPLPRPLSPVPPLHPTPAAGAPAGTAHAGGAPLPGLLFLMGCCFFWLEGNLAFVPFVGKNSEKVNVLVYLLYRGTIQWLLRMWALVHFVE